MAIECRLDGRQVQRHVDFLRYATVHLISILVEVWNKTAGMRALKDAKKFNVGDGWQEGYVGWQPTDVHIEGKRARPRAAP